MNNIFDETTNHFFEAILSLKTSEECEKFFSDVCTVKEIKDLAQRHEVAMLLLDDKVTHTYNDIVKTTGASTATISRVKNSVLYGQGGYRIVRERIIKK